MTDVIKLACPECKKQLIVPRRAEGKSAVCPNCQSSIRIEHPQQPRTKIAPDIRTANLTGKPKQGQPVSATSSTGPTNSSSNTASKKSETKVPTAVRQPNLADRNEKSRIPNEQNPKSIQWTVAILGLAVFVLSLATIYSADSGNVPDKSGVTNLFVNVVKLLGPYALLLGFIVGLGGAFLLAFSMKTINVWSRFFFGGVLSILVSILCGYCLLSMAEFASPISSLFTEGDLRSVKIEQNDADENHDIVDLSSENDSRIEKRSNPKHQSDNSPKTMDLHNGGADHESDAVLNSEVSEIAKSAEIIRRFNQGVPIFRFRRMGFSPSCKNLKIAEFVGDRQTTALVFYSRKPLTGIVFYDDRRCCLLPAWENSPHDFVSKVKSNESVYGFNLNFSGEKLVGIQVVFAREKKSQLENSSFTEGGWLGEKSDGNKHESLNGQGKPIHGFVVYQKESDIVGVQLIIKP